MGQLNLMKLRALPEDQLVADGQNLYVRRRGGSLLWFFRYTHAGQRQLLAIGDSDNSLVEMRELAARLRMGLRGGEDPRETLRRGSAGTGPTVSEAVQSWLEYAERGWRGEKEFKHAQNQVRRHAAHLLERPVASITRDEIVAILAPLAGRHSTQKKLLNRLSAIFRLAEATGQIVANPCRADLVRAVLPKVRAVVRHHPAVPVEDAPRLYQRLRERTTLSALALRLIILTACRSGEIRGLRWSEVDREKQLLRLPAERIKQARDHVVPLSAEAVAVLEAVPVTHSELAFASRSKTAITDVAVLQEMKLLGPGWTVHGMRSTFRDWGAEREFDPWLLELSLGHAIGSGTERAYARSSLVELRRPIMQAWADYLGPSRSGNSVTASSTYRS